MSFWGSVPKKLAEQRAKSADACKRNHEIQQRKNAEKRERQFELRQERREIERLRQELHQRKQREMEAAKVQEVKEQWREVMDDKEKQARDLLGIAWDQGITEAVVKAFARDRSKELHPDQNPDIDPQRYVRMIEARDYLLGLSKKFS